MTWTGQASGVAQHLLAVDAAPGGQTLWAVGAAGRIIRTVDGGTTWTTQTSPVATDLLDVVAEDGQRAWAVGLGGRVIRTIDGGASWSMVTSGTGLTLSGIAFAPDGRGLVAGNAGTVLLAALDPVADYAGGAADWTGAGANAFGACLVGVDGGATEGGGGWVADVVGTPADCDVDDLEPWNGVPKLAEVVARSNAPGPTTREARLRFAFRAADDQAPGIYRAPITFEVVAP